MDNITVVTVMGHKFSYKKFTFPAGETGIELGTNLNLNPKGNPPFVIDAKISDINGLFEVFMLTDAIKHKFPNSSVSLVIPYIPFGRQDRHTAVGTSFSLKIIANMINSMGYKTVKTMTPHSNVTELLINNIVVDEPFYHFANIFNVDQKMPEDIVILAPDAGAEKRCYEMAKRNGIKEVYVATKRRNPQTGTIEGINVPNIPPGKHIVIVDDICDGGGTFVALSNALPLNYKKLSLFVTHGIFSKGKDVLYGAGFHNVFSVYDFIYTQQNYHKLDKSIEVA